jgi:hypothetical protein
MAIVHQSISCNSLEDLNVHVNLHKVFSYIIGRQFEGEIWDSHSSGDEYPSLPALVHEKIEYWIVRLCIQQPIWRTIPEGLHNHRLRSFQKDSLESNKKDTTGRRVKLHRPNFINLSFTIHNSDDKVEERYMCWTWRTSGERLSVENFVTLHF